MIKSKLSCFVVVFTVMMLTACGSQPPYYPQPATLAPEPTPISDPVPTTAEHETITPREAQYMMSGDVIAPDEHFEFTIQRRIHTDLPIFTFTFEGDYRNVLQRLTITDEDGNLIQEMTNLGLEGVCPDRRGISFDDWTFNGYLDFAVTFHWSWDSTAFFLWDNVENKFVRNEELQWAVSRNGVSAIFVDYENDRLVIRPGRRPFDNLVLNYYEFIDGIMTLIRSEQKLRQGRSFHFTARELIDGEMVIVDEYTEIWCPMALSRADMELCDVCKEIMYNRRSTWRNMSSSRIDGRRPINHPNTRWVSQEPSMFFEIGEKVRDGQFGPEAEVVNAQIVIDGGIIELVVRFDDFGAGVVFYEPSVFDPETGRLPPGVRSIDVRLFSGWAVRFRSYMLVVRITNNERGFLCDSIEEIVFIREDG